MRLKDERLLIRSQVLDDLFRLYAICFSVIFRELYKRYAQSLSFKCDSVDFVYCVLDEPVFIGRTQDRCAPPVVTLFLIDDDDQFIERNFYSLVACRELSDAGIIT